MRDLEHDDPTRPPPPLAVRSAALKEAIARAHDELSATIELPSKIASGEFRFTYVTDPWGTGDTVAQDIELRWDGGMTAAWRQDVSEHEETSPGSSAPVSGWASWRNGRDLLLAYVSDDLEMEGWARVPGAAPTIDDGVLDGDSEVLSDPRRWLRLARTITAGHPRAAAAGHDWRAVSALRLCGVALTTLVRAVGPSSSVSVSGPFVD